MPAINGKDYIERINRLKTDIWIDGTPVTGNISEHPSFKGVMKSQAALYDLQNDAALKDVMTYQSPLTGNQVGMSYLQPKTIADLAKRRVMVQSWAKSNHGMMGRSPDYMNTVVMALASSVNLLKGKENCFPDNILAFYEYARESDISMTHTFIDPQVNRAQFYFEDSKEPIAAKVMERTEAGIIVKGAKLLATQGGITDEIVVISAGALLIKRMDLRFPSRVIVKAYDLCAENHLLVAIPHSTTH